MEKVQIFTKFEEIVASLGFLLIDVVLRGDNHLRIIEVYIDSEKGITVDDCSLVSRALNESIEAENLIDTSYRLDVSSPGVDRPLKFLAQYVKHLNRKFEVEHKDRDEIKKLIARLIRVDGEHLYFQEKTNEFKINYKDIIKAKVLISF
ncbi:MAG: ribosome maturation factor RimP [Melioribacteraceae bacterium]|jgi:ribosome maturation factor RimP|nr:ribosome maturation factor RimP [Melioribacteraceae bacterium]